MAEQLSREAEAFNAGVTARRDNLAVRGAIGLAGLFVIEPVVGFQFAAVWTLFYLLIQSIDAWAFDPITRKGASAVPLWRKLIGSAGLLANTATYGFLSVPMWQYGGLAGGVCAVLILAGGCTNAVMNTGGSRVVQAMTLGPLFAYLAATPIWLHASGVASGLVNGATIACFVFVGFVIAAHNLSQKLARSERKARRDSDRRRKEAETAISDKSTFIAAVGHDLRTPLSAILTGASELAQHSADANQRSHAHLIVDAGQMMNRLLDDLLDQARLEAGRMQVEPVVFNLRDLIARAVRFWQAQARAKGVRLIVEGGRTLPAWVETDPTRVRQILNNLLSNAVKFTREGEVRVRLNSWEEESGAHAVIVEIIDTGEGMDESQVGRLFQAFDQTRSGVARAHGGSGLGLWISRRLAELMGGRLIARSVKGEGSAFTLALTLPQAEAPVLAPALPAKETYGEGFKALPVKDEIVTEPAPAEPAAVETTGEEDEGRPLRVLVVDDHEINRRAVQLILTPLGCEITQAADGMAALGAAGRAAFDVIFMDVRMPELDGRETTRRLRAAEGPNQHTPVIAVTADSAPEDVAACAAAGMTWFVAKPLTPAALLGALQSVLSGESTLDEDESAAA